MLIPSEHRERAAMFDSAVTAAHEALTHPDVAEPLGSLVTDLEIINKTAFLPDYRGGRFHVPSTYRHEPSVAIIPLADEVFDTGNLHDLVNPIFHEPIRTWPFDSAFIAEAYGLDLTWEAHALIAECGKALDPHFTKNDDHTAMDAFTWQEAICLIKQGLYVVSRPVVVLRHSTFSQENKASVAAVTTHEELHALDFLVNGPMAGLMKFAVAGELRANYVDYHVLAGYGRQSSSNVTAIEDLRRVENDGAINPFRPTAKLTEFMLNNNII